MISYIIDPSSVRITPTNCCLTTSCSSWLSHLSSVCLQQDAEFFRIDLPNTGKVVLNKPLDYETRTHLQLIMWAQVTFRQVIHPGNQGEVRGFILLRSHHRTLHSNQQECKTIQQKKQTLWYLIVKLSQKSENNVTPLHTWQESNTVDKFNTSAVLNINIEDGDDQYPHFLPCTPVSPGVPVCMNPTYTTNITQKHQVNTRGTRWMQLFTNWLLKILPDHKMSIKTAQCFWRCFSVSQYFQVI